MDVPVEDVALLLGERNPRVKPVRPRRDSVVEPEQLHEPSEPAHGATMYTQISVIRGPEETADKTRVAGDQEVVLGDARTLFCLRVTFAPEAHQIGKRAIE